MTMTTQSPNGTGPGQWRPEFRPAGRSGAYFVTNVRYRNGRLGCVIRHWRDHHRWRILADTRLGAPTYPSKVAAAAAERELAENTPVTGGAPPLSAWFEHRAVEVIRTDAGGRLPAGPDQIDLLGEAWLLAGGWRAACGVRWADRKDRRLGGNDPRPTVVNCSPAGARSVISDRDDMRFGFVRHEGGADTWYEGDVTQDDLFRVLMAAGLLRRRPPE
jgi:hypothetical protein